MTFPALDHGRGEQARQDDAGPKVDRDRSVELLNLEGHEAPAGGHAGIGDEDVDSTCLFGETLRLASFREVGHNHASIAELLRELIEGCFIAGREHEPGACFMKSPRDVRAQTGRRAREHHRLPP